jgi:hypothetical protein
VEIVFVAHISTINGPTVFIAGSIVVLIHGHITVERIGIANTIATVEVIVGGDTALPITAAETVYCFTEAYCGVAFVACIECFNTN